MFNVRPCRPGLSLDFSGKEDYLGTQSINKVTSNTRKTIFPKILYLCVCVKLI